MRSSSVRPFQSGDSRAVQDLLRTSYEPRLHEMLTYCQDGVASYLADTTSAPKPGREYKRFVATNGDQVVAFSEWQYSHVNETHHLSHICVLPEYRKYGLARALMESYADTLSPEATLSLDVFEHNVPARNLYRSQGFTDAGSASWWRRPIEPEANEWKALDEKLIFTGLAESRASLGRYGFCYLTGISAGQAFNFCLLASGLLRTQQLSGYMNEALISSVVDYFPRVKAVFYVGLENPKEYSSARVLDTVRLQVLVRDFRKAVEV